MSNPNRLLPRYPVYIPSKGRALPNLTADVLIKDGVPFNLVVEPQEEAEYRARFGHSPLCTILLLPFANLGLGSIPARNWIKDHSIAAGAARHWQIDDNISGFWRLYKGKRVYCHAGVGLRVCEDFTDRYENIAISGLNYVMFAVGGKMPPFITNCHVYSCTLIDNALPYRWRGRYNEDTDMCLQVLADGHCTVLLNAFLVQKLRTMVVGGGNTELLYRGDGRLAMARALERVWPRVVTTKRRWGRPQHVVRDSWRKFDTPLRLKPGIDLAALPPVDDYGIALTQVRPTKSFTLIAWARREGVIELPPSPADDGTAPPAESPEAPDA